MSTLDGFHTSTVNRLIQTHEDLDAFRRTVLTAMVLRGWEVEDVYSEGGPAHRHVRFVRGNVQLDFNLWARWTSSVEAIFRGDRETAINKDFRSTRWEIFGDNPKSWEDAVTEAVQQLIERVQEAQSSLGRAVTQLRSLPSVKKSDKDWLGLADGHVS